MAAPLDTQPTRPLGVTIELDLTAAVDVLTQVEVTRCQEEQGQAVCTVTITTEAGLRLVLRATPGTLYQAANTIAMETLREVP